MKRLCTKLRVMQIVLSLAPGGTERLVIEIVRRLGAHGIESVVCCLEDDGSWAGQLRDLGVPVIALHRRPGFSPGVARAIAGAIADHRIDVVHAHHYSPFVYAQLGALLARRTRVVFTEHGRLSDARPSVKRLLVNPVLGRLPDAIFAVSHDLRRHMIGEGLPASRIQVLHNGIDPGPPVTAEARNQARIALGIASTELVVGTVARLDPVKDLATVIRAFHSLRVRQSSRLVIVGEGPEREPLTRLAAELGVARSVLLTGHRDDARELMTAFDVYANSSIHEGLSVTILEAMAAGIPIVATSAGGNPEVVDSSSGWLVPTRDAEAFTRALLQAAADSARRQRGEHARARVERLFSIERMVAEYARSYAGTARRRGLESAHATPITASADRGTPA